MSEGIDLGVQRWGNGMSPNTVRADQAPQPPYTPLPQQQQQAQYASESAEPVKLNVQLGTRQIMIALSALAAGIGSLTAAGWLAMPAKQTDMTAVQQVVLELKSNFRETNQAVGQLSDTIKGLRDAVDELRASPPRVIERERIVRPARKPPA